MVVGFFFKRVIPSVLLYYGGIQMYMVYHLYSSEGMVRTPKSTQIHPQESRKRLVDNVLAIYQCRATSQSFLNYATDVQFEDPTIFFEGVDAVKSFAFLMRSVMKGETLSFKEHHYQDQFILELKQKYTIMGFQFTLPSVVYVELEGKSQQEKIKKFHEEWYGKTLITAENTPFILAGASSRYFRGIHGRLCNIMKSEPPKE
jgi:hypothetical protein